MQKNNCKLKTIFKKGLSFSIALALGAAATSLNLAKTAYAANLNVTGARTSYLVGEQVATTGVTGTDGATVAVDSVKDSGGNSALDNKNCLKAAGSYTVTYKDTRTSGADENATKAITVYDWAQCYKNADAQTVTAEHDAAKDTALTSIINDLAAAHDTDEMKEYLKTCKLYIDGSEVTSSIDYAAHNGKAIKLVNKDSTDYEYSLGTLEVTRTVDSIELKTAPTKVDYLGNENIDLTGLVITVKYTDGSTDDIAYSEDNKNEFSFTESVEPGAQIATSMCNKDIKVTYEGKQTEKAFKLSLYTYYANKGASYANITGTFDATPTVNAVIIGSDNASYKTLLDAYTTENPEVICAYDITASGYTKTMGKIRVTLSVGKIYAGKEVTVKHLVSTEATADEEATETIETYVTKVDEDGNVIIDVNSLSPFMVVLGATEEDKAAAAETEKKNEESNSDEDTKKEEGSEKEEVSNADNSAKTESATKATSNGASNSVKTGDASIIVFSVFGFVALVSAAVLAFMKKNRKNLEN